MLSDETLELGLRCAAALLGVDALCRAESGDDTGLVVLDMSQPGEIGAASLASYEEARREFEALCRTATRLPEPDRRQDYDQLCASTLSFIAWRTTGLSFRPDRSARDPGRTGRWHACRHDLRYPMECPLRLPRPQPRGEHRSRHDPARAQAPRRTRRLSRPLRPVQVARNDVPSRRGRRGRAAVRRQHRQLERLRGNRGLRHVDVRGHGRAARVGSRTGCGSSRRPPAPSSSGRTGPASRP